MSDEKKANNELRKYLSNVLEGITTFLPQEKRDFISVILTKIDEIQASEYKIKLGGLSQRDNLAKLKEEIKKGINDTRIGDIKVDTIKEALKAVQAYAEQKETPVEYDINKTMIDKFGDRFKTLSRDEKNAAIVGAIIFSNIIAVLLWAYYSSTLLSSLIENVERVAIKFGEEAIHHLKDAASAAKFWADTQVDKLLNNIGNDNTITYRGFKQITYTVLDEATIFAKTYRENPYIINALIEKIGNKVFLRVESSDGISKVDVLKSDCEKFHGKAMRRLDSDGPPFLSLINKLSCVVEKEALWKELISTADKMKKNAETKAQGAAPEKPGAEKAAEASAPITARSTTAIQRSNKARKWITEY